MRIFTKLPIDLIGVGWDAERYQQLGPGWAPAPTLTISQVFAI